MNNENIKISNENIIPEHIAIIMDGNGRWAKKRGLPRIAGHRQGIKSVREITNICSDIGVKYLTLYTFSTENWNRPQKEVDALMMLLLSTIKNEIKDIHKNNLVLSTIGNIEVLPKNIKKEIYNGIDLTSNNTGLNLILALNYGSRQEIIVAVNNIIKKNNKGEIDSSMIDEDLFSSFLSTKNIPDPDLLIRTGGELRISNFLLWQCAYTEIYLTDTFWPDFRKEKLIESITAFQKRERRFGKTSEQIS
jgi:undecaprenyl diphosphate synthase